MYRSGIEHYEEIFGVSPPPKKIFGTQKLPIFDDFAMANLRANTSAEEHDIDNRETALETAKGSYIVTKFHELLPLTAKIGP